MTNFKIIYFFIKEPAIISIIEVLRNIGKITPTFSSYLLCILLKATLEITLIIREMHNIPPIIKAVFSTLKFNSNSCCINNFPFDCPEFTIG